MIEIVPAILEVSLADIKERLLQVRGAVRAVQLDVVDGVYARNRTWPYAGAHAQEEFTHIVAQEDGLPLWEEFDFEIDLMVEHARLESARWVEAGASRIIVHADSPDARESLESLQMSRGGNTGIKVGVALASTDEPEKLETFDSLYDFVQVMGIEHVGSQGNPFDPRALALVRALHERYPELSIQVDGGIGEDHARECADAGASRLVVGSTIFTSIDPRGALEDLRAAVNSR